ncbi:CRR6 family NdhI maturation factor [Spirulina subsalsa]|uniref:CRR6 family NdhI maturation factor n=1 Tax=Spirulina subsalsa TaxID=54311 RepID=UPI00031D0BF4|nr:CRR6 family NdhI maturation factor [Spirulina subsalsa]
MKITITAEHIYRLDISPVQPVIDALNQGKKGTNLAQSVQLEIDFPREETDPRELSEIPEVRLWFVRLDAVYPWFPFVLDWGTQWARYVAMLVPHQFHRAEGIQYNPEALEIFVMYKVFGITHWLNQRGEGATGKVQDMMQVLGYEVDEGLFNLLGEV